MADMAGHEEHIQQFMELTQVSAEEASAYLESVNWDVDSAVDAFYSAADSSVPSATFHNAADDDIDIEDDFSSPGRVSSSSAVKEAILGAPSSSSMSHDKAKKPASSSSRIRTLADINNDGGAGESSFGSRSPSQPSDDEGSSLGNAFRRGNREDLFTGGEKSGLAVQKPDSERSRLVRDILRQAELGGQSEPPQVAAPPSRTSFTGSGYVLGQDTPAPPTPQATSPAQPAESTTPVTRTLTFWRDGFSIENGSLMRYDVPANQEILRAINSGRAPLHLLNVSSGQPVDVRVERRMDEDYIPPNPAKGGFYGTGHRLGA